MKYSNKVLLGIATCWPILYIFLFLVAVVALVLIPSGPGGGGPDAVFGVGFLVIFILHMLTILLSLGLTVFYLVHAMKREDLKSDMKAVWGVLFVFFGIVAQPIYYYLYIWKEQPAMAAHDPSMLYPPDAASWTPEAEQWRQRDEEKVPGEMPDWR